MVTCCPKYSARQLRNRIKIQSKTQVADGMGGWTESWSAGDTVSALWTPRTGSEAVDAQGLAPTVSVTAIIRFRGNAEGAPYYSAEDRVAYRGRTYNIKAIMDVDGMQQFLEMRLVEGEPS